MDPPVIPEAEALAEAVRDLGQKAEPAAGPGSERCSRKRSHRSDRDDG